MPRIFWILLILSTATTISTAQRRIATENVPLPPQSVFSNPKPTDLVPFKSADGYFKAVFAGKTTVDEEEAVSGDIFQFRAVHGAMIQTVFVGEYEFDVNEPERFYEAYRSGTKPKTVVTEKESTVAGRAGREFTTDGGAEFARSRLTFVGNRLYSLSCEVSNWQTLKKSYPARVGEYNAECDRFFASFEILRFPPADVPPKPDEFIGFIDGSKYENPYFGVFMTFPEGWSAIDDSEIKNAMKTGVELYGSESGAFRRKLSEAIEKDIVIFGASVPISTGSGANVLISVRKQPAVRSIDVVNASRNFFAQSAAFKVGPATSKRRNGARVSEVEIMNRATGIELKQRLLVIMRRGYSFSLVFSYVTDSEKRAIDGIISSIAFK